jgi:hypothetical protein
LLRKGPPYWQPALAGGAEAISSVAISRAVTTPLGRCRVLRVANTVDSPASNQ